MDPIQSDPPQAPLLAAIEREIQERCEALQALEKSWLAALLKHDLVLALWLADCAVEHRAQLRLARTELVRYEQPEDVAST